MTTCPTFADLIKKRVEEGKNLKDIAEELCGGTVFTKNGKRIDRQGTWQMWLCKKCGHRQKGEKIKEN